LERGGLLVALVALVAVFASVDDSFLTEANLLDLVDQNAGLAIVAAGMLVVIVGGGLDLSVGAVSALTAMLMAKAFSHGMDPLAALALGVVAGCAIGAAQGALVSVVGVNAVIVTLAALIWARGLATAISNAESIPVDSGFALDVSTRHFGWVSTFAVIVLTVYVLVDVLLRRTRLGRYVYAQGGDREAARQAGLPVWRIGIAIFAISGALAALAGTLEAGRLGVAGPTQGTGLELDAIAAVIIGGARLSGGEGTVMRTFLGVVFIATMNNGLALLGLDDAYVYLYKGLIVLFALSLEVAARRLSGRPVRA
jgi:ribose transport system permease protein